MVKKIRDLRVKEKFVVDDAYLNGMARLCGTSASAVYMSLCRHASKDQECFPSIKKMAEQHAISTRTVIRGLQTLEDRNIIVIGKKRTSEGKWLNNSYTLLDKSVWNYSQVTQSHMDSQVTKTTQPSDKNDANQVTQSHTKDTHIKDTHKKDSEVVTSQGNLIPEIIKAFESVDPKNKNYYGNKTQRGACEFLVKEYGFNEVLKVIEILPQTNKMEYVPIVTTPAQLRDKWVQLGTALKRAKVKKQPEVIIITENYDKNKSGF